MNYSRRQFFQTTATAAVATSFLPSLIAADAPAKKRALKKAMMWDTIGYKGTVMEKCTAVKAAGFDGVELASHMNQDEVMKALETNGLGAASVCCSTHWKQTLSSPDEKVRAEGLEGLKQSLRDAKRYGAKSVLLVPGVARGGVSYQECWDRSIAEIRKAIPLSEETGVKIAIENVWNDFLMKPEQALDYLNAINSPQVGWHFDIGNMIKFNPAEEWIALLGKRILNLHFKEYSKAKKPDGKEIGFVVKFLEGSNNWPAIMREIDKMGYSGWAITEMPGGQSKDAESLKELSTRLDKILAT